jgi:mannose-6-phosphate isomerase-like protein (cupin superfamily)
VKRYDAIVVGARCMNRSVLAAATTLLAFGAAHAQPGTRAEGTPSPAKERTTGPETTAGGSNGRNVRVWGPAEGERLWVSPKSKDELGPGGEFHIYVDHKTDPSAKASFSKFSLGVGGALAEHRHEKTEELAYLLSGRGVVMMREDGKLKEVPVEPGSVWYIPPAAWHTIKNTANEPMTLVFATVPNHETSLLSFFRKIGAKPGVTPPALSKEEMAKLGAEHDFVRRPPDTKGPTGRAK